VVSQHRTLDGHDVTMLGLAKGAAMIGPRMATMLAFVLTDAPVRPADLQTALNQAVDESFHCISVEGHTSTNDTVLLLAGDTTSPPLTDSALAEFEELIRDVCIELARKIPADGEGTSHFITIEVEGCQDRAQARQIARSIANDALVKTAIAGADPNWGRIVSAAGYSGASFEPQELSAWLNGTPVYRAGAVVPFDAEALSAGIRERRETSIRLRLTQGNASARFWTCDLTAEYVRLNADYTT
jgi:glutamate N-acetyltransferase/amino-acid N-acetyltransferase